MSPSVNRVMLIDDEMTDRMMYERIINRSGLVSEVVSFSLAQDAIDYFKSSDALAIDLIFLDIRMPILSGFDFLEQVGEILPSAANLPVVVMLSTSMSLQDRERAASFELVSSVMPKPLSAENLDAAIALVTNAETSEAKSA